MTHFLKSDRCNTTPISHFFAILVRYCIASPQSKHFFKTYCHLSHSVWRNRDDNTFSYAEELMWANELIKLYTSSIS